MVAADVEIDSATTFDEAHRELCEHPPDALIVNLGPSELPWRELQRRCREHVPPIPVLFESCVLRSPQEAGLEELDAYSAFLRKPYHAQELRIHIERLLRLASGEETGVAAEPAKPTVH
jgi:DNA-binding response OmpR family regulator